MDNLEKIFKDNKIRLTSPRREVFSILNDSDKPLEISEIIKQTVDAERTSVYRTLELFNELGITSVIQVGWKQRYELAEPFRAHHHHLICTSCSEVINLAPPELGRIIRDIYKQYSYSPTGHHFELEGICNRCRGTRV